MKMQYSSEYNIPKLQGMTPSVPSVDTHTSISHNEGPSFKEGDIHLVSHSPIPCLRPPPAIQLKDCRPFPPSNVLNYPRILPKIEKGQMEHVRAR